MGDFFFLKLQFKEKLAIEVIAGKQQDDNLCRKNTNKPVLQGDQDLRESTENMIPRFPVIVNHELRE